MDHQARVQALLTVLQSYATTESQRIACDEHLQTMQQDSAPERLIEISLATAICDGLNYGNWWVWQ